MEEGHTDTHHHVVNPSLPVVLPQAETDKDEHRAPAASSCYGEGACFPFWTGLVHVKNRSGLGGKEEFSQEPYEDDLQRWGGSR